MAISYVGGVQGGRAGSTATTTQSLSGTLTGGSNTSPSAGDLVVVFCATGADTTAAPSQDISGNNSGAYTGLTPQSKTGTTYDSYHRVSYVIQGSTVDTSLTIPSSGSARNAQRWVVHVLRDVDSTTPLDVTSTYATGTATGRPNPAAITPSSAGAWILAFYASAAATGSAYTAPTDFAADWLGGTTADTADCMAGAGYYTGWTSGSYDPAAISAGGTTGAADAWTATTIALRPAPPPNTAPTVVLDSPADASSGSDTTPTLAFTGTDTDGDDITYEVQIDTVNTFDSQSGGSGATVDSYSESNQDSETNAIIGTGTLNGVGQSFTAVTATLTSVKFYLRKSGSATGNAVAKIYAHSGTFGTSSVPTGTALATSDNFDVSTLTTSFVLNSLTFSGANQISLTGGTNYVVTIELSSAGGSGDVRVGNDTSSPTHSGNFSSENTSNVWSASSTTDICFYVIGTTSTPLLDKLSNTDSGFVDVTNGADTDPFASGDQVSYTVQDGTVLSVAPDAVASLIQTGFAAGGARTWSHTCSGTDRFLVVSVELWQDVAGTGTISAMTYNGVTMTKAQGTTQGAMRAEIWYLANPPSGTYTISATVSGNTDDRKFVSSSFVNVGGLDASNTATGGTGNPSVTVTTTVNGSVVVDSVAKFGTTAFSVGSGQTSLLNNTTGSTTAAASYEAQPTAGATVMSWTNASANAWAAVALSMYPVTSPNDTLAAGTYYWRVRGLDPSGSNTYGAWGTTRSFTVTSGGTTVTPTTASLTLTTFAPTVTVSNNKSATPTTASLTLTGFAPTVILGNRVTPTTASLILTTFAPTVVASDNKLVTPTTASLSLTTFAPTVTSTANQSATPTTASLSLSGLPPTVTTTNHQYVTPSTGSLSLTTFAPTIVQGTVITPSIGSLTLTGYVPTVTISDNKTATPTTASLTLTTFAPTIVATDNKSATPTTASLSLTGFAPTVTITANQFVTPATGSLTITGFAPTVSVSNGNNIIPSPATITLTGFAPTVTHTDNQFITPSVASMLLAMFAPTIAVSDNKVVIPGEGTLTLTGYAPTVSVSDNQFVTPAATTLTLTTFAATVTSTANQFVTPSSGTLILTSYRPTISNGIVPQHKYYIDSNGNIYWVINQALGLVEPV